MWITHVRRYKKETVSRDFRLLFFYESVSPEQMEKNLKLKNFNNFVWAPLGSRVNMYKIFAFKFTLRCLQPDIVSIICHRCQQHKRNWWQNLPPVSLILVENLPPVSLLPAAICHRCHFVLVKNLPPVSLLPAAICHQCHWHRWCALTCEYLHDPNVIFRGLGEGDSWKNLKQKSCDTVPLKVKKLAVI